MQGFPLIRFWHFFYSQNHVLASQNWGIRILIDVWIISVNLISFIFGFDARLKDPWFQTLRENSVDAYGLLFVLAGDTTVFNQRVLVFIFLGHIKLIQEG